MCIPCSAMQWYDVVCISTLLYKLFALWFGWKWYCEKDAYFSISNRWISFVDTFRRYGRSGSMGLAIFGCDEVNIERYGDALILRLWNAFLQAGLGDFENSWRELKIEQPTIFIAKD